MDLSGFKKTALEAVEKSSKVILEYFHNLPPIEKKADMSPVTKADKEAEEIIITTIRKQYPNHGFLGEEFGSDNDKAEFVWIIDPIDGTKNFIHGLDFFGTVLGLKHQGKIIMGISNMPALGELLFASSEEKTTLNGKPTSVSKVAALPDAYVTVGGLTRLKDKRYMGALLKLEDIVINMRGYGDVHGYHLVATRKADVMFEPQTKPWDISAYQIIIKQAGGMYSDFDGDEFGLGPTSLATNGLLHQQMLEILKAE